MLKVVINYKYNKGHYKKIPYWFKDQKEYDTWYAKEISDESIRKIIGIE